MKIRIIGGPGSGKSSLAAALSKKFKIPCLDLDDIYWSNECTGFGVKADAEKRDRAPNGFLRQSSWIVEGVYCKWGVESFTQADVVIMLTPSVLVRGWRIMKRYCWRKFALAPSKKKETIRTLYRLLVWNHGYNRNYFSLAREMMLALNIQPLLVRNWREVFKLLEDKAAQKC
ncbi:MAG: DNA topology modulation protein FlaR [Deltaproteobacteria bacterium]|nr:DNA topology modulation protein FlaR [Deltaproteobacteria bacterium]